MSDTYKQKARKYKYKYLKLKQELEGGSRFNGFFRLGAWSQKPDSVHINPEPITCTSNVSYDLKKLNIITDYPPNNPNISIFNSTEYDKYDRRLLNKDDYEKELKNFKEIQQINNEIDKTHIRQIVFAGKINNDTKNSKFFKENFKTCDKINNDEYYGYIISKNIIDIYGHIPQYLLFTYLITAIENFIIPLHKAGYVLNDIRWQNIILESSTGVKYAGTLKLYPYQGDTSKVYFDISKMEKNNNNNKDIEALFNLGYSLINDNIKDYVNQVYQPKNIINLKLTLSYIIQHLKSKYDKSMANISERAQKEYEKINNQSWEIPLYTPHPEDSWEIPLVMTMPSQKHPT
jgi:hypothetical protein